MVLRLPADAFPVPVKDPKFLDDARVILEIPIEELRRFGDSLDVAPGFLNREEIGRLAASAISDGDQARLVTRYLHRMDRYFRRTGGHTDAFFKQFATLLADEELEFADALVERTRELIRDSPGLRRQWKAEQLATSTGAELEELRILCDSRPVYTDDASAIDGFLLIATLQVTISGPNGLPVTFEVNLTEDQLAQVATSVERAQTKVKGLRQLLESNGLIVPGISGKSDVARES